MKLRCSNTIVASYRSQCHSYQPPTGLELQGVAALQPQEWQAGMEKNKSPAADAARLLLYTASQVRLSGSVNPSPATYRCQADQTSAKQQHGGRLGDR